MLANLIFVVVAVLVSAVGFLVVGSLARAEEGFRHLLEDPRGWMEQMVGLALPPDVEVRGLKVAGDAGTRVSIGVSHHVLALTRDELVIARYGPTRQSVSCYLVRRREVGQLLVTKLGVVSDEIGTFHVQSSPRSKLVAMLGEMGWTVPAQPDLS